MTVASARPDDARWMALALTLGRRGLGRVWPNPSVGCVIVKNGRVVGRGWTQDGGRPHAEVVALEQAGEQAQGADAFVTLEPCAHTGKTGPCALALINSGVSRVVVAISDPDPRVSGRGIALLRDAGVEVTEGVLADKATLDHQGFLSRVEQHRPMVTLKLAMSLDGRIATQTGESQWITGADARREVHAMRACYDAVLIGAGTARADLPSLTVRDLGIMRQPVRAVMSRRLDLPLEGPLFTTARDVPVWLLHGSNASEKAKHAWRDAGAILCEVDQKNAVETALKRLGDAGLTRVFCEGGGVLASALLKADLVDRLIVMQAGIVLGADARPGIGNLEVSALEAVSRFKLHEQRRVASDIMHIWLRS